MGFNQENQRGGLILEGPVKRGRGGGGTSWSRTYKIIALIVVFEIRFVLFEAMAASYYTKIDIIMDICDNN